MMKKLTVITRSFQEKAGRVNRFNHEEFELYVATPIKKLITDKNIERIILISNGDENNELSEQVDINNKTKTVLAAEKFFKDEIKSQKIICHTCKNWGLNPGSATALNEGAKIADELGAEWILCWSTEFELNSDRIESALSLLNDYTLKVVGFLRENWWEKAQWNVVQNTAAIWELKSLKDINFFSERCNGTGEKISIEELKTKVLVAGMEDFHALLRMLKSNSSFRWGMSGKTNLSKWRHKFSDEERQKRFNIKISRQYEVMKLYVNEIFPNNEYHKVMNQLFSLYHIS
jgi:hypothetical protein